MALRANAITVLLQRYADGRQLCNCREAYYTLKVGGGTQFPSGKRIDVLVCAYGCQTNKSLAAKEIAERVCAEFHVEQNASKEEKTDAGH